MIWLQSPPWAKWIAVGLIGSLALWLEIRPDPRVVHPFAVVDIAPGDPIGPHNTEERPVPAGLLAPLGQDAHAREAIPAGSPVLEADTVGAEWAVLPEGWWVVSVEVPPGAAVGDQVRLVLLDTGAAVDGIVTSVSDPDPFSMTRGGVAVAPEHAAQAAIAAGDGRLAVLLSVP